MCRRTEVKVLNVNDATAWFKCEPGISNEHVQFEERALFFAHPEASCIDLEYPSKIEQLPFFARSIATLAYDSIDFRGAMVWFTEWGVWSELDERIGYRTVETINRAYGQPLSFEASFGHHFRADELTETVAMLLQPMIFGWDAFYLPRWSFGEGDEFFLSVSHDSFVTVVTRTKSFYDRTFRELEQLKFNPMAGHERRVSRFCRASRKL
jgi:hypothetical protein